MAPRPAAARARRLSRGVAALVLLVAAGPLALEDRAAAGPPRQVGDSRVVAQLPPAPGYPEGIAIRDGRVYVATAARFGTSVVPPLDPPEVQVFDRVTGAVVARHVVVASSSTSTSTTAGSRSSGPT